MLTNQVDFTRSNTIPTIMIIFSESQRPHKIHGNFISMRFQTTTMLYHVYTMKGRYVFLTVSLYIMIFDTIGLLTLYYLHKLVAFRKEKDTREELFHSH